jgi:two-component system sensor histidine kinase PilS (NtrC family)
LQLTPGGRLAIVSDSALQLILDPRRIVRWIYTGRLSLAIAIFLAAVSRWAQAEAADTLVASVGLALTMAFTAGSALYSEIYNKPLGRGFFYLQCVYDLLLVTSVVHVTAGSISQFAALYILVIAYASLVLPSARGLLVAALAIVLYFADVVWGHPGDASLGVWLQLGVFGVVAMGSSYLGGQLHLAGKGRERLVAQLEKARLEAADILRNIRSGIVTVDAGGRLLHANPAADTLLGIPLQGQIGRPVFDVIARVAPELSLALAKCVLDGIRTTRAEGTIDGPERRFPIGVTTTFTDSGQGTPATATAIFQDISDQKRLEELHLRAERLEAVAELSASLAHEIRNPLASIRSAVEQLSRMSTAGEDEKTLSSLVLRESDRLSRLLGEFLDFARVRVTKIEQVDLGAIARGATELAGKHPDRRPDVRVSCGAPAEPLMIEGDEDLLHRVVFNLALNAVQAAPANGNVRVNVGPIPRSQMPSEMAFDGGAVALSVADDGPGIAPQIRERLFTPFLTTKPGGSGLGLPVVHRATEAHQGIVLVDTGPRGTRFTVLLPRTQSSNGASHG